MVVTLNIFLKTTKRPNWAEEHLKLITGKCCLAVNFSCLNLSDFHHLLTRCRSPSGQVEEGVGASISEIKE